jgi:tRNA-specific 2-thiouridylase
LGELSKERVRELAREAGIAVADKPDSQDLCFLAGTNHAAFLAKHGRLGEREGAIVDRAGTQIGRHRGAHLYTIGQRHGLGIGGPGPLFVLDTDVRTNTVVVGARSELAARRVRLRDVTLHRDGTSVDAIKLRYRGRRHPCVVAGPGGAGTHRHLEVELAEQAERTAAGQLGCLYEGDVVVGHGTVASV